MNDLHSLCEPASELDNKELYREMFNTPLRSDVQPNAGRVQQAGKRAYYDAYSSREVEYAKLITKRLRSIALDPDAVLFASSWSKWFRIYNPYSETKDGSVEFLEYAANSHFLIASGIAHDLHHLTLDVNLRKRPNDFIDLASRLDRFGQTDAALDMIYDKIDTLLTGNEFGAVDSILEHVNPKSVSVDILLGLLTSTLPARSKLPFRRHFFSKVEQTIKERGVWEKGLLTGLES